jgi:hypothetical protein
VSALKAKKNPCRLAPAGVEISCLDFSRYGASMPVRTTTTTLTTRSARAVKREVMREAVCISGVRVREKDALNNERMFV